MIKKLACLGVAILLSLCLFAGCGNNGDNGNKYNAVLYDNANEWIIEDFLNKNRTRGAYYNVGNELVSTDESNPETRTFIIDKQEEYDEIFNSNQDEFEVDFNSQTVIVYTFTIEYRLPAKIKSIVLEDEVLNIKYEIELAHGTGSACTPYQRWFVVKTDKLQVSSVTFLKTFKTIYS